MGIRVGLREWQLLATDYNGDQVSAVILVTKFHLLLAYLVQSSFLFLEFVSEVTNCCLWFPVVYFIAGTD